MDGKVNLLENLPFDLTKVKLRSKVPILQYWSRRLNPKVKYHASGMSNCYYPAGTMFQCSGLLDYEGEINDLAYGLRTSFVMNDKGKKFFWYDLVLDVVGSSDSRITADAASLFLLFEPVNEDGNVIPLG